MKLLRWCLGAQSPPPAEATTARASVPASADHNLQDLEREREALRAADAEAQALWVRYDSEMQTAVMMDLLKTQNRLKVDLAQYFARLGQSSDNRIATVTANFAKSEARVVDLRKAINAEVQQLQARAEELRLKMVEIKGGDVTLYRPTYASDIAVFVVELSVYTAKWLDVLEANERQIIEQVRQAATLLRDEASRLGFPDRIAAVNPKVLGKKAAIPVRRRPSRSGEGVTPPSDLVSPTPGASAGDSLTFSLDDSFASTSFPHNRGMARTNTLRFMAALVRSVDLAGSSSASFSPETPARPQVAGVPSPLPTPNKALSPSAPASRPERTLKHEPLSFSSALYKTTNRRKGSIADIGKVLGVQPVRGDGRCLFRSVAKGMAFRTNQIHKWNELMERTAADRLRAATVRELQARSKLLIEYCVIEGDFDSYCRKMSNPRTWGGEPEILMLASILRRPIAVYIRAVGGHFRQIQVYGRQFTEDQICILYSDSVHYDCLVPAARSSAAGL